MTKRNNLNESSNISRIHHSKSLSSLKTNLSFFNNTTEKKINNNKLTQEIGATIPKE
jgi:hypothetical protein